MAEQPLTAETAGHVVRLGEFQVDFLSGELHRNGRLVRLNPQPCKVLSLLVQRAGETVPREDIQREVWGGDTFVDFERGLNSCIKQIRAAFGDEPDAPRYIETIPRRGYRFVAKVEPVDRISDQPEPGVPARQTFWARSVAVALAVILLVVLATLGMLRGRPAASDRVRLAVLPFENLSGDPSQDFLGDGLAEEMITHLGAIAPEKLAVIARSSAQQYKQSHKSAAEIGKELNVRYLLEGSARREGDILHVTAQLIQADDQTQLWAASYDRNAAATISIENDLAQRVARSLALQLLPASESARVAPLTQSPEAHLAYLKGRYEMNRMTVEGFRQARVHFEQALQSDPNFAPAYAAEAEAYALEPWWGGMAPREAFPKARESVAKALRLDDQLAEGHTVLGFIHFYYDWDFAAAESEFERAIQLQPGFALAHYWYAGLLSATGRHDQAIASILHAQELDPVSPMLIADAGWYFLYARRYNEAIPQCQHALDLKPNFAYAQECILESHRGQGQQAAAVSDAREHLRIMGMIYRKTNPSSVQPDSQLTTQTGLHRWAEQMISGMQAISSRYYISPYDLAVLHAQLGENDKAVAELQRAQQQRDTWLVLLDVDPRLDSLRSDSRFTAWKTQFDQAKPSPDAAQREEPADWASPTSVRTAAFRE